MAIPSRRSGSLADVRQQRQVAGALDRRGQLALVERRGAVALARADLALGADLAAEDRHVAVVDLEDAVLLEPARLRRVGALGARLLLPLDELGGHVGLVVVEELERGLVVAAGGRRGGG